MDPVNPLTSIEVQLLSRSQSFNEDLWPGTTARWLHLDGANPREEHEAAAALVEKVLLEVTHSHGGGTWYELTTQGLAYFQATWPDRKD